MQKELSHEQKLHYFDNIIQKWQAAAEEYKNQREILDQLREQTEDKEVLAGLDKQCTEIDACLNEAFGGRLFEC